MDDVRATTWLVEAGPRVQLELVEVCLGGRR